MTQGPIGLLNIPNVGLKSALNISTTAVLVKAAAGRVMQINVVGATETVSIYDSSTTAGTAASNLIWSGPGELDGAIIPLDLPAQSGIVAITSAGQIALSYL
jgi:hypothetical protein